MSKWFIALSVFILAITVVALVFNAKLFDYDTESYGHIEIERQQDYLALQQVLAKTNSASACILDKNGACGTVLYRPSWTSFAEISKFPCLVSVSAMSDSSLKGQADFVSLIEIQAVRSKLWTKVSIAVVGISLIILLFIANMWARTPKQIERKHDSRTRQPS